MEPNLNEVARAILNSTRTDDDDQSIINEIKLMKPLSNIDRNFLEAAIDEMEQDYYDGEDDLPW